MALPTNITTATSGHVALHNNTNTVVNQWTEGTGWRAITSLLENGWTATSVRIRRRGDTTQMLVRGLNGSATTANSLLTVATTPDLQAFLPVTGAPHLARLARPTAGALDLSVEPDRIATDARTATADTFQLLQWTVGNRAWPTTLPGTAVI